MDKPTTGPVVHREWATKQEIADRYRVHLGTVDTWIASGWISAYKIGPRTVRLDPAEVEAALVRPTAERERVSA